MTIININNALKNFINDVWSCGRVDACDSYLADTYTIHHDPGDPWHQRTLSLAEFKERVRSSRQPFPDQRFDLQETFVAGDAVAATWFWSGTHTGDIPGFPASGKQIKMSGATVYYFADQKITGHWQITDRLGVYQQLRSTP
jgi:steroid delta-isomerase-like uncharacterized protein